MAVQLRHLTSKRPDYYGLHTLNCVDAGTVVAGALAVSFFELAPAHNASQFRCGLVFINVSAIVGTWDFKIATELRVAQVALGNTKFNPANTLNALDVTATGAQRAGFNLWSGVNTLIGDVVYLEVRNTAGASPSVTISADAILYS
jgi:hypothetical protein